MPTIYSSSQNQIQKKKSQPILSQEIIMNIKKDLGWDKSHGFGAFKTFPAKFSFETQESKEEIVLLLRKHVITNVPWILISILMLIAPLFLSIVPILTFLPARFQFITLVFWYLFTLTYVMEKFLSWYFNVYIVTDERIVDVDFYSLVYKRISEAKIENIEDVTYSQGGFIQSMFNYGLVNIQTAAEVPEFEFSDVPQPALVVKTLNQLKMQEEQEKIEGRVR